MKIVGKFYMLNGTVIEDIIEVDDNKSDEVYNNIEITKTALKRVFYDDSVNGYATFGETVIKASECQAYKIFIAKPGSKMYGN